MNMSEAGSNNRSRKRIAVLLDNEAEYGRQVIRGIMKYVRPAKTWIIHTGQLNIKTIREITRLNCSGIIVQVASSRMLHSLQDLHIPFVDVAGAIQNSTMHQVCMDNVKVGQLAAEHFLEKGFKYFAFMGGGKNGLFST